MYTLDLQGELDRAKNYFFAPERWGNIVVESEIGGDIDVTEISETQRTCSPIRVSISDDVVRSASKHHGFVNELELAKTLMVMAEARHVYQFSHMYQQPNADAHIDMFRSTAISSTFHGYCNYMYHYLPDEIDANIHGVLDAKAYADNYLQHLDFDFDQSIVQFTIGEHGVFCGLVDVRSVDDMVNQWQMRQSIIDRVSRPSRFLSPQGFDRDRILYQFIQINCSGWLSDKNMPDPRSGTEFDEWLFAVMLDCDTSFVNKYPMYDQERLRIREKYPSKIITGVEPGSAIVPSWRSVEPGHHVAEVKAPSLGGTSIESSRDFSL